MIAASTFAPDQIVRLLIQLNRGESISFSHDVGGPLAFTITKAGHSFKLCAPAGVTLASGSTFAEVWRKRPRIAATLIEETDR